MKLRNNNKHIILWKCTFIKQTLCNFPEAVTNPSAVNLLAEYGFVGCSEVELSLNGTPS